MFEFDPSNPLWPVIVAGIVQLLKRVPFLAKYPKVTAAIFSALGAYLLSIALPPYAIPWPQLVAEAIAIYLASVGVYETVPKTIRVAWKNHKKLAA